MNLSARLPAYYTGLSMREQKIETVQPGPTHSLDSAVANLPSCSPRRGAVRVMTPMHSGWPGHGASLSSPPLPLSGMVPRGMSLAAWRHWGPGREGALPRAPPDASRGARLPPAGPALPTSAPAAASVSARGQWPPLTE